MEKHLDVPISLPYYTQNELTEKTKYIWLVTHGYGQLAGYFIRKFAQLDPEKNFIIAPQGISKFYLEGQLTGRVGASWMTKEDRLTDIENQQRLIRTIFDHEVKEVGDRKVVFFGFSQGVATIVRYAAFSKRPFDTLVLWAGGFPPDIPEGELDHVPESVPVKYYTGHDDPYYSPEVYEKQKKLVMDNLKREPQVTFFDGGHTVIPELLPSVLD